MENKVKEVLQNCSTKKLTEDFKSTGFEFSSVPYAFHSFDVSIESLSFSGFELKNVRLSFSAEVPADTYVKLMDMIFKVFESLDKGGVFSNVQMS